MRTITRIFRILPLVGVLAIVAIVPVALTLAQHPPRQGVPVVVISAPWAAAEGLAKAAGGQLIAPGRIAAIGLVWSHNPAFIEALYGAGAWVVLDGDLSRALCVT